MNLQELLNEKRVVVTDGATGTWLAEKGELQPGQPPDLLNLSNPEAIRKIHREYLEAGSEIILTNTFGANPFKLSRLNLTEKTEEINRQAVLLAREARENTRALIAGDIGPSGELLAPLGNVSAKKLSSGYQKVISVLADSGIDLFLLESFSSIKEAEIIAETVSKKSSLPIVISLTFAIGKRGPRTLMGESPEDTVRAFGNSIFSLGANCGGGGREALVIISALKKETNLPLWAKPNAGKPRVSEGKTIFPESPEDAAILAKELADAGAKFIGGCCGTTPAHIRTIKNHLGVLHS
ncbi:MAG: homocysteine S-methyltransferase family protein [Candidatus Ratteibacteria bacterium]|jgi:5-methyltetrahydrofolate--homocysteine methyltransferase